MKKLVIVAFVVALAACGGKKKNDTMNTTDTSGSAGSGEMMGSGDPGMGSDATGSGMDGSAAPEGGAGSGM